MPFIEILPLSHYVQEGNFEAIEILNKSNIVIKTMEDETRERIKDWREEQDLLNALDELIDFLND